MNSVMNKLLQSAVRCSRLNCQKKKFLFTSSIDRSEQHASAQFDPSKIKSHLCNDLRLKIKMSGPISVAEYMKQVLTHPTKGYYISKDVFGSDGDFTTSPEISQLFGEMIGVWIIYECHKFHREPFQIVELGPGRGTLSRDILRVVKQLKKSHLVSLHLVEVSPVLAEIQRKTLCPSESTDDVNDSGKYYKRGKTPDNVEVFWYKSILDIPEGFSVFVAQEFFDALPIHKFQKTKDGWFELLVDIDPARASEEKFRFVLSNTSACDALIDKDEKREHVEISLEAMNVIRYISTAITQNGGFSLIIDYGHSGDRTDTFRAFRQHQQCDPLSEPGTADLTADVDFSLLQKVAQQSHDLLCFGPVTQRDFLIELGINMRLAKLCQTASKKEMKQLELGYKKIIGEDEMGNCFKVVSMFPRVLEEFLQKSPVSGFKTHGLEESKQ
ncbi:protein arginine methyltransferase NDUFAF7, mitochondrial [Copidosoma floridanum]|uniref:protein arginine methyltransferase NDUFAF7, mitochondrial n=1 Tax=Copidosoma floridanum TaxID=29053 RepID=UPI0006C9A3B0|nr:protein arginine methyltransferase NDUFAF7, mitochondrial [Copidosoma floridanum]